MAIKTLVCVVGELRSEEVTFESFESYVLKPCNADLLVCCPEKIISDSKYLDRANYFQLYSMGRGSTGHLESIAKNLGASMHWKDILRKRGTWFGGLNDFRFKTYFFVLTQALFSSRGVVFKKVKDFVRPFWLLIFRGQGPLHQPGGGSYVFLFKYAALNYILTHGLHDKYDRFIITRSDYLWRTLHPPLELLDPDHVWIPSGEDHGGYCDRHWVLSSHHLVKCLDLLTEVFLDPTIIHSYDSGEDTFNSEKFVKMLWDKRGVSVRRFPLVQFLIRYSSQSETWGAGKFVPELGLTVAYPDEYEEAKTNSQVLLCPEDWKLWSSHTTT